MKISYNTRRKDFVKLLRMRLRRDPARQRINILTTTVPGFLMALSLSRLLLAQTAAARWRHAISIIFYAIIAVIAAKFRNRLAASRWLQKHWPPGAHAAARPIELEILSDSLMHRAEGEEESFRREDIQDVVVSKNLAFVFLGDTPYRGLSIAREAVVDGDFDEFVSQLQDRQKLKTQAS